ncbi:tripartite tricarboxylate transporter TctB family protein [Aidingimonas lacisalsi]|uniref:tripartite tricarboxylate transporter TctB family protein n=1 Tax=Aidingimonas lacisalsi TaxID=2604086 RepID=UPI0011D28D87|nr:tripartite tricarboxylate transporter TctB family protein [Aidingimonas lacisalsi]
MNTSRLVMGFFGLILAGFFYINALGYPGEAAQMPIIYSVAVAILSGFLILGELTRKRTVTEQGGEQDKSQSDTPRFDRMWRVASVYLLSVVYLIAIRYLGYIVSTVLFMSIVLLTVRTVSLRFSLIGIGGLTAVVGVVFLGFLRLPIPLFPTFL